MTGTIPSEFSEIEDLLFLDLDFNQLTGTIPESIFGLTGIIQLDLNNNELTRSEEHTSELQSPS